MTGDGRRFRNHNGDARSTTRTLLAGTALEFGVTKSPTEYQSYKTVESIPSTDSPRFVLNAEKKDFEIVFELPHAGKPRRTHHCKIPVSQLKHVVYASNSIQGTSVVVQLQSPPVVFCRTHDVASQRQRRDDQKNAHNEMRQVANLMSKSNLDIGRWLTYRLVIGEQPFAANQMCALLRKHNVPVSHSDIKITQCIQGGLWDWLTVRGPSIATNALTTTLGALHMDVETTHLPFEVLYQLEVCLSNGWLHEASLTSEFVQRLAALIPPPPQYPTRACKILQNLAASKQHLVDPMDLFTQPMCTTSLQQQLPSYCTRIRSATVTPMTTYFHSPTIDTSNRILRRYRHLEDRFLRVKFRDELYRGRLWSQDDIGVEVFNRVRKILLEGIMAGQRKFEFLAFGNSQFREHGAYFFAPTHDLSTEDIRRDMGTFDGINIVAKYAARLGQSFSTTRAASNGVQVVNIPDIYHNGHCFTDGVGKISLFMAQMIARDMNLPSSVQHCPSAYQFRLAGCKGVLAIDKQVKGTTIQVRPSQTKFTAKQLGLEIVRAAQFSASFLNQQVILILSALGIQDHVFMARLDTMLSDLNVAVTDETTALRMLQQSVDINQTTILLANMTKAGFMQTKEPFLTSCLRLWRAWSIKYLKEKAKILIEQGAFLLGCIDEYDVLRGHYDSREQCPEGQNEVELPELFVQISVYDPGDPGKRLGYKVIEGLCVVLRNPALHPGDIRVVMAVDKPELHHLRDVVVFPQNGDRDLPSMCAGGDLDGDDFLVIWDPELIPKQRNVPAMNYSAPAPITSDGPITVDAIVDFYVQHMKYDNLGRIATAHRYWADQLVQGVKDDRCLQLASLHSQAVDYAKTGVPAPLPQHLKTVAWPHWAESRARPSKIYRSTKILGQLYDHIDRVSFDPAMDQEFNKSILSAYQLEDRILEQAALLKTEYDGVLRELMLQHGVRSEFEICTGFVMQHNESSNDYTLAEALGRSMTTTRQHFRSLAYEQSGTDEKERDANKIGPFIAAMYMVTAQEAAKVRAVSSETGSTYIPCFISFPWIFAEELGLIANNKYPCRRSKPSAGMQSQPRTSTTPSDQDRVLSSVSSNSLTLDELPPLPRLEGEPGWSIRAMACRQTRVHLPPAGPVDVDAAPTEGNVIGWDRNSVEPTLPNPPAENFAGNNSDGLDAASVPSPKPIRGLWMPGMFDDDANAECTMV